ncbi:hypothetical protein BDP27DRAFT_1429782 [Rhodocollybia butyracea]|uniref:Uncharacterized protein n=1 Tax=Rhodocollybia butyracea TaxID=206335 RepID=A0A9P5PC86_9AGAR|nr:hypothetical protein BDP27DRAFT_1429782 [Rhodocollybia butyracea]
MKRKVVSNELEQNLSAGSRFACLTAVGEFHHPVLWGSVNAEGGPLDAGHGFRTLRSGREFSKSSRGSDILLANFNPQGLLAEALARQEAAFELGDDHNEVVSSRSRLCPQKLASLPLSSLLLPRPSSIADPVPISTLLANISARPHKKVWLAEPPASASQAGEGKARQKAQYRAKRRIARTSAQKASGSVLKAVVRHRVKETGAVTVDLANLCLGSGWSGKQVTFTPRIVSVREVFEASGLRYVEWDVRVGHVVQTASGHRFMAYLPPPKGETWPATEAAVSMALEWLYESAVVDLAHWIHRRGRYVSLPAGFGFGGGRTCPGNYANSPHNAPLVEKVLRDKAIQCIAQLVDSGLQVYFPKLHLFLTNLQEKFIAWSLGVVVPFPAGATIYVPSACVTHGNVPIAPEETRSSIAFFTPAGIARWFHNGYMSDKEFKERASPRQLRLWKEYREKLWETGLELLQEG